ncbi:MAG TPA: S8 family peptidase [Pyrinomonadaceae bacterium]|jgi:subtilisin family serine protease|nr:S8 family peptidase [Pyrinomonadaceae bacterium]
MNRNNFLIHVALAIVLILVAAFAGQLNRWRKHWKAQMRIVPAEEKARPRTPEEVAIAEGEKRGNVEVLVKFKSGVSSETIEALEARINDRIVDRIENAPGWTAIDDLDDASPADLVAQYRSFPEVEYAEENFAIEIPDAVDSALEPVLPRDPQFEQQWALANSGQRGGKQGADISATMAWASTTGSDDVVVAVLDTGVDYTHEDLLTNMWLRPASMTPYEDNELGTVDDVRGFNAVDNASDPMDDNGHGTHCAGIIGAEGGNDLGIAGVNWKVKIMPLKFLNADGSGNVKDAIEAINYAIARKKAGVNVRIISASWGSTQKSRALEDVIRKAYENDILFVAAAGNSSVNNDRSPHYPSSYNVPNVVSVAALNRNDELAPFSNWGAKSVALGAPGVDILSTWLQNGYEEKSGTSMATPVVSGVAALVIAEHPRMSVDDLRKKLLASTDPIVALKGKTVTGGRINAAKAME